MTVFELIRELTKYPPDQKITIEASLDITLLQENIKAMEFLEDGELNYVDAFIEEDLSIIGIEESGHFGDVVIKAVF